MTRLVQQPLEIASKKVATGAAMPLRAAQGAILYAQLAVDQFAAGYQLAEGR
jgi:hypothetical protein